MSLLHDEDIDFIDSEKLYPPGRLRKRKRGPVKKVKYNKNLKRLSTNPVKRQRTLRSRKARHLGLII